MKAKEILDKYVKEEEGEDVGVIAILTSNKTGKAIWYHVHEDEDIPDNMDIAVHIRNPLVNHFAGVKKTLSKA